MARIPTVDYKAFLIGRKFPELELSRSLAGAHTPATRRLGSSAHLHAGRNSKATPSKRNADNGKELAKRLAEVQSYREELDKLTADELRALYEEQLAKKHSEEDNERFFSRPSADADFDYWSKMAHWTLDEAVALSFGKSPAVVSKKSLSSLQGWQSPFVQEYTKALELAQRALPWKKLFDPVMPSLFIKWAKDNDIPVPDELVDKVAARSAALLDWKKMYDELLEQNTEYVRTTNEVIAGKNAEIDSLRSQTPGNKALGTRERDSLLKLIIGMAVSGYGYDPKLYRSSIPQEIADDLSRHGLSMDVDTVRKWLREASELLPSSLDD